VWPEGRSVALNRQLNQHPRQESRRKSTRQADHPTASLTAGPGQPTTERDKPQEQP
jgi:hypothetical protein